MHAICARNDYYLNSSELKMGTNYDIVIHTCTQFSTGIFLSEIMVKYLLINQKNKINI